MTIEDMDPKILWLFIFVGLYWAYCLFWGIKGAIGSRTASDYMIAGRSLGLGVFVLAATAASFSGWAFFAQPGLIYHGGFQYAYVSFFAVAIPFAGVLFLKRQWLLGTRFGFITPGEMLAAYYRSDLMRLLTVLIALVFAIPFLGVQLRSSGFLFSVLTDGQLDAVTGMWLLAAFVAIYVVFGGFRAVAHVGALQGILLVVGIVALGAVTVTQVPDINAGLIALVGGDGGQTAFGGTTPDGYSSYVAIPGVIQFVSDGPSASGGVWTGAMILTYMFALMGIQAAPAFSMWAFSSHSPAAFAPQQVWMSAFLIGIILFVFTALQGIGAHFLGADPAFAAAHPELVNPVIAQALQSAGAATPTGAEAYQDMLVPQLIGLMADTAPWLVGLLAVCALAAMQSAGAAYISTTGSMISRDILRRFLMPNASDGAQNFWGRLFVLLILGAALYVATAATDALLLLGGLAVAYGLQMWPALIGVCWWPFLNRAGVVLGLIAGLIAVTMTESIAADIWPLLGYSEPLWGRWPLTIHAAGWGIVCNFGVAIVVSALTQTRRGRLHRLQYHAFLDQHASLPPEKKALVPIGWLMALSWFFFAVGPGAVIGNTVFGDPNNAETWRIYGLPSIWVWQLIFWALGVFMMWYLAYKCELSTAPRRAVSPLVDDASRRPAPA